MPEGGSENSPKPTIEAAKRELFSYLLEERGILRGGRNPPSAAKPNEQALSFAQEQLWFLDQLNPGSAAYNICRAYHLVGSLSIECLQRGFDEIARRHATLRSSFTTIAEQPCQQAIPELSLNISLQDLRDVSPRERNGLAIQLVREAARTPFTLAGGPLLRIVLLRLDDELWTLCVVTHQIVCDGPSFGLLNRELETFYRSAVLGEATAAPELPIQYSDYVRWQRSWLKDEAFESQLSFWRSQLTPLPETVRLPVDYLRPGVQSSQGSRRRLVIAGELTTALKVFCGETNASLFETMLSAFFVLLGTYSQQQDIVLGCPVSNRYADAQNLIGLFVNTLVLRVDLSGGPSFSGVVMRVRDGCRAAFAHRDMPFQKLVEVMSNTRELSGNPLFKVMFALQGESDYELHLHDLKIEPIEIDNGTAKFDLMLSLEERGQELVGFIEYSTSLFEAATVERMANHFQTLLEAVVDDPNQSLSALPLLSEAERRQLVYEWNDTAADYPKEKCIHQLFEERVERTPDAIAVAFADRQITYSELNRRANQLANYLIGLDARPGELIGMCVERSIDMVVGMFAILKAGAAYVPLDPAYPEERLRFMLEDAGCRLLLTQPSPLQFSTFSVHLETVCLDRDWELIAQKSADNPATTAGSETLAYVIYTSGSTGQPKGVQVPHRSVVNCLFAIGRAIGLTDQDTWCAVTTISFDIAALEIFLPLITGAKVNLASREESLDGEALAARLDSCAATVVQATPTAWNLLLDAGWKGAPGFKVLCGGEPLSRRLANRLLASGSAVWNLYGPTETTIWSTAYRVEPGERPVYIGQPISNTQIYILDSNMQPVPIGVHGDLYIGGDGLARGYLNRPELTGERFIANPFSDDPDALLYKTGDRARYRADRNIEFLGRMDSQVKIRGHRIELGEIEAVLERHPAVRDAVIVARDHDSSADKELVGYVVLTPESKILVSELRDFLQNKLPDYMIPSVFVPLDALPQTPNGKVDRNALPPPDGSRPELARVFVEPRSELEELVTQVWREVLKLDKVGIHDNFFELGGHSLLATRVVARLRACFNIDLSLRKLFELPTVAELSKHIDALRRSGRGVLVPAIVVVPRDRVIPLSFSQQRLWFLRQLDRESTAYNISAVFRIRGSLNLELFERALNAVIARHEILRTVFAAKEGTPAQIILDALEIRLSVIDLGALPGPIRAERVRELASAATRRPFDLENGPLLRATILFMGDDDRYLLLNVDHMILDGASMALFYQEISANYQALVESQESPCPPLVVQYADYAVWQHERLGDGSLEPQLEYWKRQLGRSATLSELPTDHGRPRMPSSRGARVAKTLAPELTSALKELSRREGVTPFMTLLAAFEIIVARHTGAEDIVIGSTIAGRSRPETENLIGFFINALPLRVDLSSDLSFVDLLKRVREVCLDAYTHQDVPFEKIVLAVNPQRDLRRNPLFQILFNVADVSERVLPLAGCEVTREPLFDPEAKFDLTLYAPEKDDTLELAIVYNLDLFERQRVAAILDQYTELLAQAVAEPLKTIGQYGLLTGAAKAALPDPGLRLSDDWKGSIHDLLANKAEETPGRLALSDNAGDWSYAELERTSNQLANYLIAGGIEPGNRVAIYAQRDASLVVALLGVLKAGAVFMILDPAYPAERLRSYLRVAQLKGWIQLHSAGEPTGEILSDLETMKVVCRLMLPPGRDEMAVSLKSSSITRPSTTVGANDPAYIAFTSGSTGEPKGVVSRHGPMTHFLPWQNHVWNLRDDDRFALLSGLAYNHLHRDVFTPLALGATLYVPPLHIAREPVRLCEWIRDKAITVLHLTPALGELLLTAGGYTLPSVRRIFFGGDVLTQGAVGRIRVLAPNATIGCFYGATETQRAVGYYEIPAEFVTTDLDADRPIPLGRGIEDVQLLVLNKRMQLAGVSELGELYVRSPHLAAGYLDDDARTAEVFIPNPFTNDPADRLYKTGEIARYRPDGNVEWAGRNDRRVNIRGFRVELEEIEAVLNQHPTVKDAAVILADLEISKSELRNPKFLVAYVVSDEDPSQSLHDLLHSYLSSRLPDYMVPAHIVVLEQLPLSPNGKVDYRALPPIGVGLEERSGVSSAPRNEVETKLCEIIGQVLGREQVGIDDNFFRIGGHSLSAALAAARIREAFSISFELRQIFETPTIFLLAKDVELRLKDKTTTPIRDETDREEIEL